LIGLWILAAKYEFEDRNNIKTARLKLFFILESFVFPLSYFSNLFHSPFKHLELCYKELCGSTQNAAIFG
jgi:hypothetical protein